LVADTLHLLKLCVGAARIEDLAAWQARYAAMARAAGRDPTLRHVTRMWPRRAEEILAGGSLYWVFSGLILARQRVLSLEPEEGEDGVRRCAIVLDPEIVRTEARARRPFQGWRYLPGSEAPPDLPAETGAEPELPVEMHGALAALGVVRRRA
jgi:hypothetical protein